MYFPSVVFLPNYFLSKNLFFFPHSIFVHFGSLILYTCSFTYSHLIILCCLSSPCPPLLSVSFSFSHSAVCFSTPTADPLHLGYAAILAIHSVSVSSPPPNKSEGETGCIIHELQAGRQCSTCDESGRVLLILLEHA